MLAMMFLCISLQHFYFVSLHFVLYSFLILFFFNDTATTEIYTLSLHDALPISKIAGPLQRRGRRAVANLFLFRRGRSEEHTSELQSHSDLVCRLLLEKKKKKNKKNKKINNITEKVTRHVRTQTNEIYSSRERPV